uniref:C-type lectin domain-containing protein n=1 Tax=Cynoglossus semilaevis TaxID=244447 RepID=A0A3P8UDS9_CYNSE
MVLVALLKTFSIYRCFMFPADSHCDNGYLLYRDFCYHFETETVKSWQDAEDHCTSEQGHLVSFHSEEELKYFGILINIPIGHDAVNEGGWDDTWIGLNDLKVQGFFTWSDEHMTTFTHWAPGEPNNHEGFNEDCVEMWNTSWWNDLNCDTKDVCVLCPQVGGPVPCDLHSLGFR